VRPWLPTVLGGFGGFRFTGDFFINHGQHCSHALKLDWVGAASVGNETVFDASRFVLAERVALFGSAAVDAQDSKRLLASGDEALGDQHVGCEWPRWDSDHELVAR